MRSAVFLAVLLGGLGPGCAGRSPPPAPEPAVVSFEVNVPDAEVWVDDVFYPDALRRGILVRPGEHRIEIRHDDYHARYFELTLAAGERHTVDARLVEVLP
ncbi:MAG TPA: hypothetical protein VML75_20535 [Kofleriaceae bacterium]|nr:hypothetical protein [Kofleriaceae bacterium]